MITYLFTFSFHEICILERKTIKAFFSNNVNIEAQGKQYKHKKMKLREYIR